MSKLVNVEWVLERVASGEYYYHAWASQGDQSLPVATTQCRETIQEAGAELFVLLAKHLRVSADQYHSRSGSVLTGGGELNRAGQLRAKI